MFVHLTKFMHVFTSLLMNADIMLVLIELQMSDALGLETSVEKGHQLGARTTKGTHLSEVGQARVQKSR